MEDKHTSDRSARSNTAGLSVQRAAQREIPVVAELLARTLADDPLMKWMFPDDRRRNKQVARHFARLLRPHIERGVVTTIGLKSVAVWTTPNPPRQTRWERYRESLYMRLAHGRRVHEVRDCLRRMAERHPRSPHWYLLALATDRDWRGQGLAGRLLEEMLDECDQNGQAAALETSLESNLAFYERFGFRVTDALRVDDGLTIWLMCRGFSR